MRADTFDQPRMEVLVTREAQKLGVIRAAGCALQLLTGHRQHRAVAVLEPAGTLTSDQDHEDIPLHRWRLAKELDMGLAHRFQVEAM